MLSHEGLLRTLKEKQLPAASPEHPTAQQLGSNTGQPKGQISKPWFVSNLVYIWGTAPKEERTILVARNRVRLGDSPSALLPGG